jgi:hypothetical protein
VEWNLELDDKDNFIDHPLTVFLFDSNGAFKGFEMLIGHASRRGILTTLAFSPSFAVLVGVSPRATFVLGCAVHASNTCLLFLATSELFHIFCGSSRHLNLPRLVSPYCITVACLAWSLHPTRGEVIGWLSCQSYLFATSFALASVRSCLRSLHERDILRAHSVSSFFRGLNAHLRSAAWFALACGCKAVRSLFRAWC